MAKDPAFLFYPGDWLGGTMGMSFEEKGAYIDLLMMQFNRGHMTSDMVGQTVGHLWVKVKDKFIQDDSGLWYNERLDAEKNARRKYTESRKNNLKGENQHTKTKKKTVGHMTSHMEDININKDINSNSNKKIKSKKAIVLPFDSREFSEKWEQWIQFRSEIKKPYKSDLSVQGALKELSQLSESDAIATVDQSIAGGWQGFFPLKNITNGHSKSRHEPFTDAVQDEAKRRFAEFAEDRRNQQKPKQSEN